MRPPGSSQSPFITFLATRPMRDGALIHAKYLMIARIVVSIWILDLVLILALVLVRGKTAEVAALFQGFLNLYPGGRGPVILGLLVVLVPVFTWKLLADGLVFGLTGRGWIADSSTVIGVSSLMLMLTAGLWVSAEPSRLLWFPPFLVGALAVLAIVKLVVAVAAFRVAWRRGLVAGTAIGGIAATWTVLATATMTLAGLLLPGTGLHVSTPLVQVASLLTLPLGRFALAPLALDWNRHR